VTGRPPGLERKPVFATNGIVATSQPLAASAGLAVLRRGGNAVDAAVATAITLTVVQPASNDIGGDLFALVWRDGELVGLNASGRSPAALTREQALERQVDGRLPARGWMPVTVPGAPAGWRDLHDRFGTLPFVDLFTDAIGYAQRGYPVSPTVARLWQRAVTTYEALLGPEFEAWADVFAPDGRAPGPGERFRNPAAARTLRLIAETGAEAFYRGEVAEALHRHAEATGGRLTSDDLAAHRSEWVKPLTATYRDHEVWELPPNGQGVAALQALSMLDGLALPEMPVEERVHRQIEAMKLAFADAHAYVADPDHGPMPRLLADDYVAQRRRLIGPRAARPVAGEPDPGGTVYLCTADRDGMMVSLIQSTYLGFGSYVVLPEYGFGLQNRGFGFSLAEGHPNAVGPGKRPFHTIIPGFLTRGGEPVGPFGVMGGHMQPQGHVQVISATVDRHLDPQASLDAPRWYWDSGLRVRLEPEFGPEVVAALRRRGHEADLVDDRSIVGNGQIIWRTRDGYVAGSESRTDGYAAAY
jgi:gamma-glutamyltranspeptidase/glutathione hydrolase